MLIRYRRSAIANGAGVTLAIAAVAAASALLWAAVTTPTVGSTPWPPVSPPTTSDQSTTLGYLFSEDFPALIDVGGGWAGECRHGPLVRVNPN